jgi:hypothetical protein
MGESGTPGGDEARADDQGDDRRRFLAKAAVAGAAAWVTPMVVSRPALAATTGSSATVPPLNCDPCSFGGLLNGSFEDGVTGWGALEPFEVSAYAGSGFDKIPGGGDHLATPHGVLAQAIAIPEDCFGRPFRLSFFANWPGVPDQATANSQIVFSDTFFHIFLDDPFRLVIAPMPPRVLQPFEINGVVPTGGTPGFTVAQIAINAPLGGVDLVDLSICS